LGLLGVFFKSIYRESGKHMKKQFVYSIFTSKQSLPKLQSLHCRSHKSVIQRQNSRLTLSRFYTVPRIPTAL